MRFAMTAVWWLAATVALAAAIPAVWAQRNVINSDGYEVMVDHAEAGLRQWLNLTLVAGAALVVFGVLVAVLGGLVTKSPKRA